MVIEIEFSEYHRQEKKSQSAGYLQPAQGNGQQSTAPAILVLRPRCYCSVFDNSAEKEGS
jgi:hypothetical protein